MTTAIMHQSALYDFGELILKKPSRSVQSQVSAMTVGSTGVSMSAAAAAALEQHAALQRVNSLPAQRALAGLLDRLGRHRRLERTQSEPAPIPPPVAASRYKTELCRPFEEAGVCKYGDKCQFAHGMRELRNLQRHPKYKTDLCRTFHSVGFCPYGPRCHFVHNAEEARRREPPSPGGSVASLSSSGVSSGTSGYRVTSSPSFSSRSASPPTPQSPGAEEARLPVFNRLASAIAAFGDLAIV